MFELRRETVKAQELSEFPLRARVAFGPISLSLKGNWLELKANGVFDV